MFKLLLGAEKLKLSLKLVEARIKGATFRNIEKFYIKQVYQSRIEQFQNFVLHYDPKPKHASKNSK